MTTSSDTFVFRIKEGTERSTNPEKGEFLGTFVQIVNFGVSTYKVIYRDKQNLLKEIHMGLVMLG